MERAPQEKTHAILLKMPISKYRELQRIADDQCVPVSRLCTMLVVKGVKSFQRAA